AGSAKTIRIFLTVLTAERIHYERSGRSLLSDVSFSLSPGRFTAIVGPNGAGKSTLLKALSKEILPSQGRITLDGIPMPEWTQADLAKHRAVLPQDSQLLFPFTAVEVVQFGRLPLAQDYAPSVHNHAVNSAMARVGIAHLSERHYPSLSGGERQRVHLARVLAQLDSDAAHARYLLLDEPTSSLDLEHQHSILQIAREEAEKGRGVLAVLHDLNLASRYADEIIVLQNGQIVAQGSVREVITPECISRVFKLAASIVDHPSADYPMVIPL
ncbi:MAG: heme ABC transporter ATP-binding protein, partial [Pseudomonadota bacterium]